MAIPIRYMLVVVFVLVSTFKFSGSDETSTNPTVNQAMLLVTFKIYNLPTLETLAAFKSSPSSPSASPSPSPSLSDFTPHTTLDATERANATFVILCRNSDLDGVIQSVRSVEDRFNRKYGYSYVFLNEEPFDDQFKRYAPLTRLKCMVLSYRQMRRVSVLSSAQMEFGTIPHDHWYAPPWIDEQKAADAMKKMAEDNVIYGGMSY